MGKGVHGKFNIGTNARAGVPAVPKGDDDNWESTKACLEPKNPVPDTTDNNKKQAKKEPPKDVAPPAKPPPPKPKAEPAKTPSSLALPDSASALRDFKENVLGFSEDGGMCGGGTADERFQAFVAGPIFSMISSSVILANTIFIGIETQTSIQNQVKRLHEESQETTNPAGEYFFNVFFVVELFMRIVAQKKMFVFGPDKYWNLFDTFLILISLFGWWLMLLSTFQCSVCSVFSVWFVYSKLFERSNCWRA